MRGTLMGFFAAMVLGLVMGLLIVWADRTPVPAACEHQAYCIEGRATPLS